MADPTAKRFNQPLARIANSHDGALHGNLGALWIFTGTPAAGDGFDGDVTFDKTAGTLDYKDPATHTWSTIFTFAAGGSGVLSLNGLTGALTIAAGSGISVSAAGSTVTIGNTGVLSLTGTSGATLTGALTFASGTNATPTVAGSGTTLTVDIPTTAAPTFAGLTISDSTTLASATSLKWEPFNLPASTLTLTGTTHVTTAIGLNLATLYAPTIADASAVTVDYAATLTITGPPVAAGSVTITYPYPLWVQSGRVRFGETTVSAGHFGFDFYCTSVEAGQAIVSGGSYYNGTNWIAKATTSSQVFAQGGAFHFSGDTGLTVGNPFTPTERAYLSILGNWIVMTSPTDRGGRLQYDVGSLSSTANSTLTMERAYVETGNTVQIYRTAIRGSGGGSDWTTLTIRDRFDVDGTGMAYIDWNPAGTTQGLAFGTGSGEAVRLYGGGRVGIGAPPAADDGTHFLQVAGSAAVSGVVSLEAGTSGTFAKGGGALFSDHTDVATSGTTETDLYTHSVGGNVLVNNDDSLEGRYWGIEGSGAGNITLALYFAGVKLASYLDGPSPGAGDPMSVEFVIIRDSSTSVRWRARFWAGTIASAQEATGSLTGLVLSSANVLKITGLCSSSASFTAKAGNVKWFSSPSAA